ncbi:MAG: hypothetical protein PVI21_04880 [Candidatus Woesebacteria bacterium]|jgi:hypothetical protein
MVKFTTSIRKGNIVTTTFGKSEAGNPDVKAIIDDIAHWFHVYLGPTAPEHKTTKMEYVFEGGQSGLHIFAPTELHEDVIAAWGNVNRAYMSIGGEVCDCYNVNSEGGRSNEPFLHLPLEGLFRGAIFYRFRHSGIETTKAVQNGTYRKGHQRDYLMRRLAQAGDPTIPTDQQFAEYLRIHNQLTSIHLNPGWTVLPEDIMTVWESTNEGKTWECGFHIAHTDPVVLRLIQHAWGNRNPISQSGTKSGCYKFNSPSCIHFELGERSRYLAETPIFKPDMKDE